MKVMTIVGTRPEIIKLSRVIPELDKQFEKHVLVHTGQNWDPQLKDVFFEELGIRKPDEQIGLPRGAPVMLQIASILAATDQVLEKHKPDAVLVLGDTNSALSVYAAKRRHIPIFHMEAGNRCFDQRVPEEVNRKIVDHVSDINLVYTEHARRNLLAEGLPTDRIIKTGSPMREVFAHCWAQVQKSTIVEKLGLEPKGYIVASIHREENVDSWPRLEHILAQLSRVSFLFPVVLSLHPRTKAMLAGDWQFPPRVIVHEPFGFIDYSQLQAAAACVISDSGSLTEDAANLNFPAVMLRQAHERPEGVDEGNAIMADVDTLVDAVNLAVVQGDTDEQPFERPADYAPLNVSRKVARIIQSYTSYVQRNVWKKS